MNKKETRLKAWCENALLSNELIHATDEICIEPLSGDASFRRYYRIKLQTQLHQTKSERAAGSWIAVDAPPEKENSEQFCEVAKLLADAGVCVPKVLGFDKPMGFMLLSDLGDRVLLDELNSENVNAHYQAALDELVLIQKVSAPEMEAKLPDYDQSKLLEEMRLFEEWFVKAFLCLDLEPSELDTIHSAIQYIAGQVSLQTKVCVHRDFHSRNIMLCANALPEGGDDLAIIDFQDAVIGPITYDLVSLLKDCYVEWPKNTVDFHLLKYYQHLCQEKMLPRGIKFEVFEQWFHLMGLQRHIKVLGIFCRLNIRDGKAHYMSDLPLTFKYVDSVLSQLLDPELKAFSSLFNGKIKRAFVELTGE